jgi:galactitol-specific phosphotransferase system IIB component
MAVTTINDYVQITLASNQSRGMESLVQISQKLVERMNEERRDVAVDVTRADLVEANRKKADLIAYKAKIADHLSAASKAKNAIEWVSSTLNSMLSDLQALAGADAETRAAAAAAFDEDLAFINSKVDGANQKVGYQNINLVGNTTAPNFSVDDLYVRTSERGGSAFMDGVYMGARFNIEDAEGDLWRYDETKDAYVEYSSDGTGTPTGNTIAGDGLTVDSYDSDTGAVTLGGSGSLSGTVVKGGLGVLKAEFYDDFADDAAVDRAIDDVTDAISYVTSRGAAIKAQATLVSTSNRMIQEKINQLSSEISSITQEELAETDAQGRAARLKMTLAINNINLAAQAGTGMIENLLELTKGQQPAVGVFGALGY